MYESAQLIIIGYHMYDSCSANLVERIKLLKKKGGGAQHH